MFSKILKYFNTIKYLKLKQIFYRLFYLFRNKYRKYTVFKYDYNINNPKESINIKFIKNQPNSQSFNNNTFTFLNLSKTFSNEINWNFSEYGKLWTYNLNYFDFLNQKDINVEEGVKLIDKFISSIKKNSIGLEPFPISIRCINWIKFLRRNNIKEKKIDSYIYIQYEILLDNLEYHILGNHLLESGFSLLFGAYYFDNSVFYNKSKQILQEELNEQILADGGHFELSPMYHGIILLRVLDCVNLVKNNDLFNQELSNLLEEKAAIMLNWFNLMTFENGNIPLFNDSANKIAISTTELNRYAADLGIALNINYLLSKSGYRKIKNKNYEMIIDIGNIGPDYIPGHAHSDTFNFELYLKGQPVIVDTGVSTYEKNDIRQHERSTMAHNTVQIENFEQTEIWSSFRVGRRAYIKEISEANNKISAYHTGYEKIGAKHKREFEFYDKSIIIRDNVISSKNYTCFSYLHFHPDIKVNLENKIVTLDNFRISFNNTENVEMKNYYYAPEFNKRILSKMIICKFFKEITIEIIL